MRALDVILFAPLLLVAIGCAGMALFDIVLPAVGLATLWVTAVVVRVVP